MHRNVIRFVALDLVLRFILTCMNLIPFELNLGGYHLRNLAADVTGFRVPTNVIANLEVLRSLLSGHCLSPIAQLARWCDSSDMCRNFGSRSSVPPIGVAGGKMD